MNEKIDIIKSTLGVNQNQAEKALNLANGDLDKAIDMIDYIIENHIVIHGKISYGKYNKTYILFSIIANGKKGEIIKVDLASTSKSSLYNINLDIDHKIFVKTLSEIDKRERKNINNDINFNPKRLFTAAEIFELFNIIQNGKEDKIKNIFKDKIEGLVKEAIDLDLYTSIMTKVKLENYYPDLFSEEENKDQDNSEQKEDNKLGLDVNLNCIPLISPSYGKKVTELDIGDKIVVEISDTSEIGRYLSNLLKTSEGVTFGSIKKIDFIKETGRYSVLIEFGPSIYGNLIVSSELKIETPESNDKKRDQKEDINSKENNGEEGALIVFALISLISILVILIVLIF
ncbi:DUF4899 domain-containing protein [Orenia marismortui]|uniref:DUF4899 domain-containing protein n=1 Tax=Orenia marismortui TaxID=46469 RepID=UPI00037D4233|nr:DUF4899 domain-containing protein [Orenia marismortui]